MELFDRCQPTKLDNSEHVVLDSDQYFNFRFQAAVNIGSYLLCELVDNSDTWLPDCFVDQVKPYAVDSQSIMNVIHEQEDNWVCVDDSQR